MTYMKYPNEKAIPISLFITNKVTNKVEDCVSKRVNDKVNKLIYQGKNIFMDIMLYQLRDLVRDEMRNLHTE